MVYAGANGRRRAVVFAGLLGITASVLTGIGQRPADAVVTSVKGWACGQITHVGLFGGTQAKLGCAPQAGIDHAPATDLSFSPSVELPPEGSATAITATKADGSSALFANGLANLNGGLWPDDVAKSPPSGPITVSTQGTPAGGTVTSSVDITLDPTPNPVVCGEDADKPAPKPTNCFAPGGFGPPPVWGDSLHAECSATESSVTGTTRFSNAFHAHATDSGGAPLPSATVAVPNNPPPNFTLNGTITNVGDVFTTVYNEQIINADGSLTVNAVHMYLFGPVAIGHVIKGQVTCGTTPSATAATDTVAPSCGAPVIKLMGPSDPREDVPRKELVGTFDAGGLKSITNLQVTHGTVQVGNTPNDDTNPNNDYLKFTSGQTGPLALLATRTDEAEAAGLPMGWSFDATDMAGNTAHCTGVIANPPTTTTPLVSVEPGDSVSVSGSGLAPSVAYRLRMGTSEANCRTTGLLLGGNVTTTASGTIAPVNRVIPTNATSGRRFLCWVRVGDANLYGAPDSLTVV